MTYVAFLNWMMLTRLLAALWPGHARPGGVVVPMLAQLIGLSVFQPNLAVLGVACSVVFFHLPMFRARLFDTFTHRHESEPRLVPLLGTAAVSSFLFNNVAFEPGVVDFVTKVAQTSVLFGSFSPHSWRTVNVVLFGLLLLTNEVNLVIRWTLRLVQREPTPALLKLDHADAQTPAPTHSDAEAEYNAGRVIGIVERYLMLGVLAFSDNYEALAFILAAKGFARFKQMEQRAYAEYVLIGTLLSTLSAIAVTEMVKRLLV